MSRQAAKAERSLQKFAHFAPCSTVTVDAVLPDQTADTKPASGADTLSLSAFEGRQAKPGHADMRGLVAASGEVGYREEDRRAFLSADGDLLIGFGR
ncbi:hypothetical protein JQ609_00085 [Bradyrhizobium sp. AUGA SZCCT0169]|uniref:hypothetical protein n=1 Tax=Bradyrhizobium sp. AUGA SZCCT0169 TaxID=2807663 RepID=UPI001BA84FE1|nr:hypothetical protein [Bradyrhizobium sp. AUGA SZCCT0169]MBR1245319.1 hypothetical protein [Bradyrhizobium sp. AUGA SZCCT0169]